MKNTRKLLSLVLVVLMLLSMMPSAMGEPANTTRQFDNIIGGGNITIDPENCNHQWGPKDYGQDGPPTCTSESCFAQQCTICGTWRDGTDFGSHNWVSENTAPTCTKDGYSGEHCTNCGEGSGKTIPALGHKWGEWEIYNEPTCIDKGLKERICSRCKAAEYIYAGLTDHTFGEWYIVIEPKVGEAGLEERKCSVCDLTEQRELPPLEGAQEPTGAVELLKTVISTPENGIYYTEGEIVSYGIEVILNGNVITNLCLMDPLLNDEVIPGVHNGEPLFFWDGSEIDAYYYSAGGDYVVTAEDVQRGFVENTAYATFTYVATGEEGSAVSNTVSVPCGSDENFQWGEHNPAGNLNIYTPADGEDAGLTPALRVTKSLHIMSTPQNGEYYVPGAVIDFIVSVENLGDSDLFDVALSDPLFPANDFSVVPTLTDTYSWQLSYTVTEIDAANGFVENVAWVYAYDENGNQLVEYSNPVFVPCGFPENPADPDSPASPEDPFGIFDSLSVIKEEDSQPANGTYYTEGEVIKYVITYTNDGEMMLTDVEIFDIMNISDSIASAEMLHPGESRTCYYEHTVTAQDVEMGYVANSALSMYPSPTSSGYKSASSNTVISDTDGEPDPEVPVSGTPSSAVGVIDLSLLRDGSQDYCVRTITGKDNASASYETSYCSLHADTQSSALVMRQAAGTPEMQMQASAYAVALWRTEVEEMYQEIAAASDPLAFTNAMTEYFCFLTEVANYEALLNALYPDQPALVADRVAAMWEDKCVNLCYEAHADAAARKDSLLCVAAASGASYEECACETTAEENGSKAYTNQYCPTHGFTFSMIDALLHGEDTEEAWNTVRQIWNVELTGAYNQLTETLGDGSALALAEYNTLKQWMQARETMLLALYPENPEVAAQTMVKMIMDRVSELCAAGK